MAIGWITILQAVPWSEVIRNAPKVAEGAKRLLGMVGGKPAAAQAADSGAQQAGTAAPQDMAALQARVRTLETTVAELHEQMLASSELIKALAEQNTQLIRRVEVNRMRTLWLGTTTLATAAAVIWLFATAA